MLLKHLKRKSKPLISSETYGIFDTAKTAGMDGLFGTLTPAQVSAILSKSSPSEIEFNSTGNGYVPLKLGRKTGKFCVEIELVQVGSYNYIGMSDSINANSITGYSHNNIKGIFLLTLDYDSGVWGLVGAKPIQGNNALTAASQLSFFGRVGAKFKLHYGDRVGGYSAPAGYAWLTPQSVPLPESILWLKMESTVEGDTKFTDSSSVNRKLTSFGFYQSATFKKTGLSGGGQNNGRGYLEVTDSSGINLDGVFSIDFDYNQQESSANISIFGKGTSAWFQRYQGNLYVYGDNGATIINGAPAGLVSGTWAHIQLRRNSANLMELLVNNVVKWSGTVVGNFMGSGNTNALRVGWNGNNAVFTSGNYDEFRIVKEYITT